MLNKLTDYVIKPLVVIGLIYLFGYFLVLPGVKFMINVPFIGALLSGGIFAFLCYFAFKAGMRKSFNDHLRYDVQPNLPETTEELRELGIKTPVDFCVVMQDYFWCEQFTMLSETPFVLKECQNEESWAAAAELFKSFFKKNLHGYSPISKRQWAWTECLRQEALLMLHRKQNDTFSESELFDLISPEIREQYQLPVACMAVATAEPDEEEESGSSATP